MLFLSIGHGILDDTKIDLLDAQASPSTRVVMCTWATRVVNMTWRRGLNDGDGNRCLELVYNTMGLFVSSGSCMNQLDPGIVSVPSRVFFKCSQCSKPFLRQDNFLAHDKAMLFPRRGVFFVTIDSIRDYRFDDVADDTLYTC